MLNYRFLNQESKPKSVYLRPLILAITSIIFLVAGFAFIFNNTSTYQEFRFRYDNETCVRSFYCQKEVTLKKDFVNPTFSYHYANFPFKSNEYISGRSIDQLLGLTVPDKLLRESCLNYTLNSDLQKTTSIYSVPLKPNDIAIPCGTMAAIYERDRLSIATEDGEELEIERKGLVTESQFKKYKQPKDLVSRSKMWVDIVDEGFILWMESNNTDGVIPFGKLNGNMKAGNYTFMIENHPVAQQYSSERWIVISTGEKSGVSIIGLFLEVAGGVLLLISVFWSLYKYLNN